MSETWGLIGLSSHLDALELEVDPDLIENPEQRLEQLLSQYALDET